MEEHDAVRRRARRASRLAVSCAALALFAALWAPRALAVAPDLTGSSLSCADDNGGAFRAGDPIKCTLVAAVVAGTQNATISATVQLPSTVEIDPAHPPPAYDANTRTITFGPTVLGFTFAGQQRLLGFWVLAGPDLTPGTSISLTANLTAVGSIDASVTNLSVTSLPLVISPPTASLDASAVACADDNGGTLLPGEQVTCQLDVANAADHEDAASVVATMAFSGGTWVSGGLVTGVSSAFFGTSLLGSIPSGTDKQVGATFRVSPDALGGSTVSVLSLINGVSTPSGDALNLGRASVPLVVSPGPARLTASSLQCKDTLGGLLLAGDDLTCTVTVVPTLGYEDVQGATATVDIPAGAAWVSGGDGHDATTVSFDTPSLGDIAAGTSKSAVFHLRIADGTAAGTTLRPAGTISATSVPIGGPVQQVLLGNFLTVGQVVVVPGESPPAEQPVTPIVTPPAVKPPAAPTTYRLRAKTIKFVFRHGHRRGIHVWKGSKRRSAFVKKYVVRTPAISGKVVKRVTVPTKGRWRPKRGKVTIKGTKLTYTLKKGVSPARVKDRFHYTITDTHGRKATGTVIVTHN